MSTKKGTSTPPNEKPAAVPGTAAPKAAAAPAKDDKPAPAPSVQVQVPAGANAGGAAGAAMTPVGASQPATPGGGVAAASPVSGAGSAVQSPTAQGQAPADGAHTATDAPAQPAAATTEDPQPITEAAVKKLLDPLSRDQLYAILLKLGLDYETVLNEIKAVAQRDPSRTKLFVRELAWKTTSETLHKVFSQYGEIVEAAVVTDRVTKKSRGFGFVTFRDADSAARALEQPAKEIDGRVTQSNLASVGNPFKRQGQPGGFPRPGYGGEHQTPHHWQQQHGGRPDFKDAPWQQHNDWQSHHAMGRGTGITTPLSNALHLAHGPPSPMNAYAPPSPMYGRPPQHNGGGQHHLQMQQSSPIHAVGGAHVPGTHHHQAQAGAAGGANPGAGAAVVSQQPVAGVVHAQPVAGSVAFGYTNTPPLSPSGQYGQQQYGFNYQS